MTERPIPPQGGSGVPDRIIEVKISVDSSEIDSAIEKLERLKTLLLE